MSDKIKIQFFTVAFSILFISLGSAQDRNVTGPASAENILASDNLMRIHSQRYQPDSTAAAFLHAYPDTVTIYVFFGSWCRESRKYLPGFIKTMQLSAPVHLQVNYVGVDAQKKVPESFLKMYNIKYIPTVVVLEGNEEIGRIEEAPHKPIELELVEILRKEKKF